MNTSDDTAPATIVYDDDARITAVNNALTAHMNSLGGPLGLPPINWFHRQGSDGPRISGMVADSEFGDMTADVAERWSAAFGLAEVRAPSPGTRAFERAAEIDCCPGRIRVWCVVDRVLWDARIRETTARYLAGNHA